jgi:hypothetical protein
MLPGTSTCTVRQRPGADAGIDTPKRTLEPYATRQLAERATRVECQLALEAALDASTRRTRAGGVLTTDFDVLP